MNKILLKINGFLKILAPILQKLKIILTLSTTQTKNLYNYSSTLKNKHLTLTKLYLNTIKLTMTITCIMNWLITLFSRISTNLKYLKINTPIYLITLSHLYINLITLKKDLSIILKIYKKKLLHPESHKKYLTPRNLKIFSKRILKILKSSMLKIMSVTHLWLIF
jgi:hypothetical protein